MTLYDTNEPLEPKDWKTSFDLGWIGWVDLWFCRLRPRRVDVEVEVEVKRTGKGDR